MIMSMPARQRVVLNLLQENYERRGYAFIERPGSDLVPPFLNGHHPDAIAVKPAGGGVVIKVMSKDRLGSDPPLADIAALFKGHADWQFKVHWLEDFAAAAVAVDPASLEQIVAEVQEVEELFQQGRTRAAFLLAWAVLEAIARALEFRNTDGCRTRFGPAAAIEYLVSYGYIETPVDRRLYEMIALRNAVAHGDFGAEIRPDGLRMLIDQVRALLPTVANAPTVGRH